MFTLCQGDDALFDYEDFSICAQDIFLSGISLLAILFPTLIFLVSSRGWQLRGSEDSLNARYSILLKSEPLDLTQEEAGGPSPLPSPLQEAFSQPEAMRKAMSRALQPWRLLCAVVAICFAVLLAIGLVRQLNGNGNSHGIIGMWQPPYIHPCPHISVVVDHMTSCIIHHIVGLC